MQYFDIHVCLISDQAAPNLLPILDSEFKPKEAIFLVSDKMKKEKKDEFLKKTFEEQGVKVTLQYLSDVFDFEKLDTEISALLAQYKEKNIALNVTGGTKLLAIAAQNIFAIARKPIFYMETEQNRIIYITKSSEESYIPNEKIKTNINLSTYLSAYGTHIVKQQEMDVNTEYLPITNIFIDEIKKYQNVVPLLNAHATKSQNNGYKSTLEKKEIKINSLDQLLIELSSQDDFISYDGTIINFRNKNIRTFLNGGWLEDLVFSKLKKIESIDDIACNLEVGNPNFNPEKSNYDEANLGKMNEFDIAFMAKNRLHIVECKTLKMDKNSSIKPEDILYKLETIKNYGGSMTKKCLVTYMPVTQAVKNRAKELNILLIEGEDIKSVRKIIQKWI